MFKVGDWVAVKPYNIYYGVAGSNGTIAEINIYENTV
jgi:hypothetical protein